jgi:PIN domain nuclease of toxin-antitoxin system
MIVLDTAVLLFWTLDPQRLTIKAKEAIETADRIIVSSISIWEIALKVKMGKLELPLPVLFYVDELQRLERLTILPVEVQHWLDNLAQEWDHCDPADRTIVALAKGFACPLVTSDQVIRDFYLKSIW